ncbi:DNA sulfur modification protein DndE [Ileibacterium valens]|uniref:DNA sulfur modification protein DndE n=1 Tax=Ileibacterium valens TaxID=1862668 RepID=UPI00272C10DE|nr:DNA sulfur modification protein DndE [Ileibacterium valens]
MIVRQIRLSTKAKDSLIKLKAKTGIQNWNVLCRWAYCYSLSEDTIPIPLLAGEASNVEMSWQTFAGEYSDLYEALLIHWCSKNGKPLDQETLSNYFRLHLERGIGHLAGTGLIRSLDDLLDKALEE